MRLDVTFSPQRLGVDLGGVQRVEEPHSYPPLQEKPQINGVTLVGNKSFEDLGEETITNTELQSIINDQYNMVFGGA